VAQEADAASEEEEEADEGEGQVNEHFCHLIDFPGGQTPSHAELGRDVSRLSRLLPCVHSFLSRFRPFSLLYR
jgi:hypothetical protein